VQTMIRWLLLAASASAAENGLARLPPLGWRSWNLYGGNVNQTLIEGIMASMVRRSSRYTVDGVPTSLCDLGFCDVGLDDNWQACGRHGEGGYTYHDEEGNPLVNSERFPSMKSMTSYAHSLGLTAGWYGNNCICSEKKTGDRRFYAGDVRAMREMGFDSWKLDGCGAQTDMQLWSDLIQATPATTGRSAIMVENCHWGSRRPYEPTATWCPWNFYRTSGDVRATYGSVIGNLQSVFKFSGRNLSYPGCWAYADMLEVGVLASPFSGDKGLTIAETRSHFAAWAIVSSPLTLSHDPSNLTIMDAIWPVLSNRELLAISQAYAGYSGGPFKEAAEGLQLAAADTALARPGASAAELAALPPLRVPAWQYLYKPLEWGGRKAAVLLMNHGKEAAQLTLAFADVPGLGCRACSVRDVWSRKDVGTFNGSVTLGVGSHDCALLVLTHVSPHVARAAA